MCAVLWTANCLPGHSVSTVTLSGTASATVGLSAGDPAACSLVSAPGITDGSATFAAVDTDDPFTDSVNLGTLTNGNGTNSVASIAFRQRGNSSCHVSCSVSSYTPTNISYNGSALTGLGSELSFVKLSSGTVSAGPQGSTTGFSYGSRFTSGTDTLATLNSGTIAAVNASQDRFVSFTSGPSRVGGTTGKNNWVQDVAVFSVPTGFIWGPTGSGSGNWAITIQFAQFAGP